MVPDISLDNMTLVGKWRNWGEVLELVQQWAWEDGDDKLCRILPARSFGTVDYQRSAVVDGCHVSNWCQESEYFCDVERESKDRGCPGRIEFNPNKLSDRVVWLIQEFEPDHASRIDVAIDYPGVPIGAFVWRRDRVKSNVWVGAGGVESLYLGSRGSDRCVRVYDKALELRLNSGELTRVEGLGRKQNVLAENLFDGVEAFRKEIPDELDLGTAGRLALFMHYPDRLRAADPKTLKKAKELAREIQQQIEPTPAEVYHDRYRALVEMAEAVSEGERIHVADVYRQEAEDDVAVADPDVARQAVG